MNIENLSDVPLFAARPVRRVQPKNRAAAWIIVGCVNLLVFNLFIFSQNWPDLVRRGGPSETTLNLTGVSPSERPDRQQVILPDAPSGAPPEVVTQPIIIPPPLVEVQPQPEERGGITAGDLLGAIGREVACSAGNYENLTMTQRSRCGRIPWQGAQLPNGAIVLQIPPPRNRFFEEENSKPAEVRVTGADAQRNRLEGASDGCPVILNTPCFNRIPGRN